MPLKVIRHDLSRPVTPKERAEGLARLLNVSHVSATGCWDYQNSKNQLGYGQLYFHGDSRDFNHSQRRLIYERSSRFDQ